MMLHVSLLLILVGLPAICQTNVRPTSLLSYQSEPTMCDSDDDCDSDKSEVCWRLYSGCYHGVCMCDPSSHLLQVDTGKCQIFRSGNEPCSDDSMCMETMACVNGSCQCEYGDMSPESNYCLLPHHKLLGHTCHPSTDICLQNTARGYVDTDVWCSQGRCLCKQGFKQYDLSCVKPRVTRCTRSYQCEGGFICLNRECSCPHNYWPVAHNTKCAKENAIVDLPLGAHCDEINESKYCASGLICHQCYSENHFKCVKYSLSPSVDTGYQSTSAGDSVHLQSRVFLICSMMWICGRQYAHMLKLYSTHWR